MKTCPKCNEILGDSVKVCVKCRYQFEQDELQEALDKSESVQKVSQRRIKDVKRNRKIIFFILLFICLTTAAFLYLFGTEISFVENGGIRFDSSRFIPYEYTLYWDHAALNKYLGEEQEVDVPASLWGRPVTVIGDYCFARNNHIVRVRIPQKVVEIGVSTFAHSPELVEVTGGEDVETVGSLAFVGCSSLTNVDLGTKIARIKDGAFMNCEQLKQFVRQEHLEYIDEVAFADSGLEEFEFNSSANVWAGAFVGTPWIDSRTEQFILFGDGSLLYYYNGAGDKIVIPNGVNTMLTNSVEGMNDSEIILPQTVQKLEYNCFLNCANIKIYIPSSVEDMDIKGHGILSGCSEVTIVTTKGSHAEEYAKEHDIPYEIVEGW